MNRDTGELAIAETEFRRTMRCSIHLSVDDGETWTIGGDPTVEPHTDCGSDPVSTNNLWLTWAPDGVLHYVFTAGDPEFNDRSRSDRPRSVFLARSTDGGRTFDDTTTVYDAPEDLDEDEGRNLNRRTRVEVDPNDPSLVYVSAPNGRMDIAWYDFRNSPYPEGPIGETGSNEDGFHDVYYTSSDDRGATFESNMRVTDRIINREIGVWSNNIHIHGHVGVASTDDTVYFAWQDTRNGDPEFQSEDIYFAKMRLGEPAVTGTGLGGTTMWAALAAALVFGMGLAMVIAGVMARRR